MVHGDLTTNHFPMGGGFRSNPDQFPFQGVVGLTLIGT